MKSIATANAVRIGRDIFPVATLREAVATWQAARDSYGWAASEAPRCTASVGGVVYRISYNGRAWNGDAEVTP